MKRNIMNKKIESAMKKFNQWTMKQQTRNKHKIKSITHEHVYFDLRVGETHVDVCMNGSRVWR